jgi:hypothetical protein
MALILKIPDSIIKEFSWFYQVTVDECQVTTLTQIQMNMTAHYQRVKEAG